MQTFLPYPDFIKSAEVLDYKRLGKQRLEAKQILETNLLRKRFDESLDGKDPSTIVYCKNCNRIYETLLYDWDSCNYCNSASSPSLVKDTRIPWENHPAVIMWRNCELALARYGWTMCLEWKERGYKDSLLPYFTKYIRSIEMLDPYVRCYHYTIPHWFGYKDEDGETNEIGVKFHLSHQSNLVRKDPKHYRQFFPDVPDDLPYIWPYPYTLSNWKV